MTWQYLPLFLISTLLSGMAIGCSTGTVRSAPEETESRPTDGGDTSLTAVDSGVQEEDAESADFAGKTPDVVDFGVDTPCVPSACDELGHNCGEWNDGCGGTVDCGGCAGPGERCRDGACVVEPVDCSGIDDHPSFELCEAGDDYCAGVFTNGEGCDAFCAAAGLQCSERRGGEPGCLQEPQNVLSCGDNNGHLSDWCVCGGGSNNNNNNNGPCAGDPGNPPTRQEQDYTRGTYSNRSAWVLECRAYAYTAQFAEHESCDSQYVSGSGKGSVTFQFAVARGQYDVYIDGRHTTSRNPAGALVEVTSDGQTHTARIMQRDEQDFVEDFHGRYCLDGAVEVVLDSTDSSESDSVRRVILVPAI